MQTVAELTADIKLRPRDLYQPLAFSRQNVIRWAAALFACYLIYTTRPIWLVDSNPGTAFELLEPLLFCAFVSVALFSWPYVRIRSMFHTNPALSRSRRVSFNAGGMRVESEHGKGDYKWSVFYQIVETPKTFLLMQTTSGAVYIPKRCLSTSDDVTLLRQLIRDNFTGKKWLRTD